MRQHTLVAAKINTQSGRLIGVWSPTPAFGNWVPVGTNVERTAKALVAWWNSTPAWAMLLNRRARTLIYPMWAIAHLREIRIPKPDNRAWPLLRDAFEQVKNIELLPMAQSEQCSARRVIDEAAAVAMEVPADTVADWRQRLTLEPSVNNRYARTARRSRRAA